MKIIITGDLVLKDKYDAISNIDPKLIKKFNESDLNIVNLEAPITNIETKIQKTGPHHKSHSASTLNLFKLLNINVAALANNHIKDFTSVGVEDTLSFCEKHRIKTVGAGRSYQDAAETLFIESNEGNIAVINIAENEWSSAKSHSAGANGMDLIKDITKIQEAREKCDFVIVIVHGGLEYYNLPSPRMQKQYRFYADQGADLVVGHHTHCISGYEVYNGTPIYYSLGNFLFTKNSIHEDWYTGSILEVDIQKYNLNTRLTPISFSKDSFKLGLVDTKGSEAWLNRINEFNKIISDQDALYEAWLKKCSSSSQTYLNLWSPLSFIKLRYTSSLLRRLKINFNNSKGLKLHLNLMRCETHRDISQEVIEEFLSK